MFTASPLSQYNELIAEAGLRSDDHQRGVVERLQKLHDDLKSYTPPPIPTEVPTQSFVCILALHWIPLTSALLSSRDYWDHQAHQLSP